MKSYREFRQGAVNEDVSALPNQLTAEFEREVEALFKQLKDDVYRMTVPKRGLVDKVRNWWWDKWYGGVSDPNHPLYRRQFAPSAVPAAPGLPGGPVAPSVEHYKEVQELLDGMEQALYETQAFHVDDMIDSYKERLKQVGRDYITQLTRAMNPGRPKTDIIGGMSQSGREAPNYWPVNNPGVPSTPPPMPAKRGPGRPRKTAPAATTTEPAVTPAPAPAPVVQSAKTSPTVPEPTAAPVSAPAKRGPGRPRKVAPEPTTAAPEEAKPAAAAKEKAPEPAKADHSHDDKVKLGLAINWAQEHALQRTDGKSHNFTDEEFQDALSMAHNAMTKGVAGLKDDFEPNEINGFVNVAEKYLKDKPYPQIPSAKPESKPTMPPGEPKPVPSPDVKEPALVKSDEEVQQMGVEEFKDYVTTYYPEILDQLKSEYGGLKKRRDWEHNHEDLISSFIAARYARENRITRGLPLREQVEFYKNLLRQKDRPRRLLVEAAKLPRDERCKLYLEQMRNRAS